MSLLKKIRNFFVGMPAPEVIDDTAMDIPKPKPKPKPRTLLAEDHIDYLKPLAKRPSGKIL
jgi:hypothetical protein